MWACAIRVELRIPGPRSLKEKRAVLRPHIERLRRMASLSVCEVGAQDAWQRASVGVAMVLADAAQLDAMIEKVHNYFEEQLDIEIVEFVVSYPEEP